MGLDIFATYLGNYLFGEITSKYSNMLKKDSKIDFKTLTSSTLRGIHPFCFPFILNDEEGKQKFVKVFKKAINYLPKIKPRVRQNYMAEKIAAAINNLLELYLAISCEEENFITQLLDELLEIAPEIMEFASGKLIEVFKKKMDNLEKTLSKTEDNEKGFKEMNFYEIDNQILNVVGPYFKTISVAEDISDEFKVNELIKDSQCLTSAKEREIYNKHSDVLPDVFMRLCPLDLVKTFSDEYKDDIDDNISVYSGLTMETEMTMEEKEEKSSKILAVFNKLKIYSEGVLRRPEVSTKTKLAMVVITAAILEYGEFMLDFDRFMKIVKFDDEEVDVEELEKEIMVDRNYERLGAFCNLKTIGVDLKKSFIKSLIRNKEYDIILRCDKFDNGYYCMLQEQVLEEPDFLNLCVEEEIKLKHWDRIAKFVKFIQQNNVEVADKTTLVLKTCLIENSQAGLKVLELYPHLFYIFKDFYDLATPLLKDDKHRAQVINIVFTNVVEIYTMSLIEGYWDPSESTKQFLIYAMTNLKDFLTYEIEDETNQKIKFRKRVFLERENIIGKLGKTFKHNWSITKSTPDGEIYHVVHKMLVSFSKNIEVTKNLTIFDMIYFIGKNDKLMNLIFGAENKKNWYEVIYETDLVEGSVTSPKIATRIRFLNFMTQPISQFIADLDKDEIKKELDTQLKDLITEFGIVYSFKSTNENSLHRIDHEININYLKQYNDIEDMYLGRMQEAVKQLDGLQKSITSIKILRGKMRQEKFDSITTAEPSIPEQFYVNQYKLLQAASQQKSWYKSHMKRVETSKKGRAHQYEEKIKRLGLSKEELSHDETPVKGKVKTSFDETVVGKGSN